MRDPTAIPKLAIEFFRPNAAVLCGCGSYVDVMQDGEMQPARP